MIQLCRLTLFCGVMRTGMMELGVILSRRYRPPTLMPNFMPLERGRDSNSILIVLHSNSTSVSCFCPCASEMREHPCLRHHMLHFSFGLAMRGTKVSPDISRGKHWSAQFSFPGENEIYCCYMEMTNEQRKGGGAPVHTHPRTAMQ